MREIITLQVGQCGNQIATEFWKKLLFEHGIDRDGTPNPAVVEGKDCKDVFFYQDDNDRFVPRAVLIDSEPGVIDKIRQELPRLFSDESIYVSKDNSGAGNSWSLGYSLEENTIREEKVFDLIRREAENSDSLSGFMMCHSIAGGTGSGFGSYLLEKLSDSDYKKKIVQTYSVFPDGDSHVTVSPYNCIFTLKRLVQNADCVMVLDNKAIYRANADPNFDDKNFTNAVISDVMSMATSTLRFPSYTNNDLVELLAPLIPTPRCHFLLSGLAPISVPNGQLSQQRIRKTSVYDVMSRLLDSSNMLATIKDKAIFSQGRYISLMNIIQGDIDVSQVNSSVSELREGNRFSFVPWAPTSIQVTLARRSPYDAAPHRVRGLMLAHHTSIHSLFSECLSNLKKLSSRGAFMSNFEKHQDSAEVQEELKSSKEVVTELIEEYKAAQTVDYINLRNSRP